VKLENQTWLQAHLFWGASGEQDLGMALIARATYELQDGGLARAGEAPWPIHLEELETPYGIFPADNMMPKPRVDVTVLGKARAPGGEPVRRMRVRVSVGESSHAVEVFGHRTWVEGDGGLEPSPPLPFTEMDLTLANAFGGVARNEWGEMPNPNNPAGKGWVYPVEQAAGVSLPNIEHPDHLIQAPGDQPPPACLGPYPMDGGLRLASAAWLEDGEPRFAPAEETAHLVFNHAHPDMMFQPVPRGARIRVEGVWSDGPLETTLPDFPGRVVLCNGEERLEVEAVPDTLTIQVERRRLTVRWRAATSLPMRPREERFVLLEPLEDADKEVTS